MNKKGGCFSYLILILFWIPLAIAFFGPLIPILIVISLIFTLINKLTKINNKPKINKNVRITLDMVDNMTGQEFEDYLINVLLPLDDFTNINGTSYTGDYGVDVIAKKYNQKYAIQCKRYNNKVSNKAIQEIYAGKEYYKCDKAMVITNNFYTQNAHNLANQTGVILLDRNYIIQMIKKYNKNKLVQ